MLDNYMNKTILIVEDEQQILELINEICKDFDNCKILCAADGESALDLAKKNIPDMVLLDVLLPKMDGHEVCKSLKSDPVTSQAKVLMISGMSQFTDLQKAREAGADAFLPKPFSYTQLIDHIKKILI
jgi:two-component system, OmpR family, alkaline phosphatase synthesis response regulator PhoP